MPSTDERTHDAPTRIVTIPDSLKHRRIPPLPVFQDGPKWPLGEDTAGSPYDLPPATIAPTIEAAPLFEAEDTDTFDVLELDPDEDTDTVLQRLNERWTAICDWGPLGTFGDWYESIHPVYSYSILGSMCVMNALFTAIIVWLIFFAPASF